MPLLELLRDAPCCQNCKWNKRGCKIKFANKSRMPCNQWEPSVELVKSLNDEAKENAKARRHAE